MDSVEGGSWIRRSGLLHPGTLADRRQTRAGGGASCYRVDTSCRAATGQQRTYSVRTRIAARTHGARLSSDGVCAAGRGGMYSHDRWHQRNDAPACTFERKASGARTPRLSRRRRRSPRSTVRDREPVARGVWRHRWDRIGCGRTPRRIRLYSQHGSGFTGPHTAEPCSRRGGGRPSFCWPRRHSGWCLPFTRFVSIQPGRSQAGRGPQLRLIAHAGAH